MEHEATIAMVTDSIINPVYTTNHMLLVVSLILLMILFTLNKIYKLMKVEQEVKDNIINKSCTFHTDGEE